MQQFFFVLWTFLLPIPANSFPTKFSPSSYHFHPAKHELKPQWRFDDTARVVSRLEAFIKYSSSSDINDHEDGLGRLDDLLVNDARVSATTMGRRELLFLGGASAGALLPGPFSIQIDSRGLSVKKSLNALADEIDVTQNPYPNSLLLQCKADGTICSKVNIPLIAYSFYKTSSELAPRGLALALRAGVRHFDMATDYGNSEIIAPLFQKYFKKGEIDWNFEEEKADLLEKLDLVRKKAENSQMQNNPQILQLSDKQCEI